MLYVKDEGYPGYPTSQALHSAVPVDGLDGQITIKPQNDFCHTGKPKGGIHVLEHVATNG